MTYIYEQPNMTAGMDDVLFTTAHSVPAFPIMLLLFIFSMVVIGGSSSQKRRTGSADMPMWFVLAGVTDTFVALLMTISPGMIDLTTLSIVIAVTIMCGLWFFRSKVRGEQ